MIINFLIIIQDKKMKKMKSIVFVIMAALMFCAAPVMADNSALAHSVDLGGNDFKVYSKSCVGFYKIIWGRNASTSAHGVWFVAEYKSGSSWVEDGYARVFLKPGEYLEETSTFRYTTDHTWRLKLDVYGPFKQCQAAGYIRNK